MLCVHTACLIELASAPPHDVAGLKMGSTTLRDQAAYADVPFFREQAIKSNRIVRKQNIGSRSDITKSLARVRSFVRTPWSLPTSCGKQHWRYSHNTRIRNVIPWQLKLKFALVSPVPTKTRGKSWDGRGFWDADRIYEFPSAGLWLALFFIVLTVKGLNKYLKYTL